MEGGQFIIKTDHESLKFLTQQNLHTNLQKKGMAKLMGMDFVIQYKREKENAVVDALSRCYEEGDCAAITTQVPDWYQEVTTSYNKGAWTRELLEQLSLDKNNRQGYTICNGLMRYRWRLVIGDYEILKKRIFQTMHDSPLGGHSGI